MVFRMNSASQIPSEGFISVSINPKFPKTSPKRKTPRKEGSAALMTGRFHIVIHKTVMMVMTTRLTPLNVSPRITDIEVTSRYSMLVGTQPMLSFVLVSFVRHS